MTVQPFAVKIRTMDTSNTPKNREEAFVDHLIGCQSRLATLIFALVHHEQAAQDILQETNLVLWRKSDEFREGSSFWAWASQVARYQVKAYLSKMSRDRLVFPEKLLDQLVDEVRGVTRELDERTSALLLCLDKLPPEKRELITNRYQADGGVAELAEEVGKSHAAVSKNLFRIRRQLLVCVERELAKGENQ